MSNILDPLTLPLTGQRLIEASAGTGKTYTITSLYLRLLLNHGDDKTGHGCALNVDQILVVTFTEAATAELRGRIRERIHQARLAFIQGSSKDPVIQNLIENSDDKILQIKRLLSAEQQMDEAAIYTIHGFCQRMLTQNAFESGSLFEQEFVTNQHQLLFAAVADFWRNSFYGLDKDLTQAIRSLWKQPADLLNDIALAVDSTHLNVLPDIKDADWKAAFYQQVESIKVIKKSWLNALEDIAPQVSGHVSRYTGKSLDKWLESISRWAKQETNGIYVDANLQKFASSVMAEKLSKTGTQPSLALFDEVDRFFDNKFNLQPWILKQAISHVKQRLTDTKQQLQQRSFTDLLVQLESSLQDKNAGTVLQQRISEQYPLAMIDEFQDTDPLQYNIFQTLYSQKYSGREDNGAADKTGLLMIGDPKQAIYGFRGADIFTYIEARRQVKYHYTLDRNWRSSEAMVNACNQLFQQAEAPFIYARDIQFHPVKAAGKDDCLKLNGQEQPALNLWYDGSSDLINGSHYQSVMANSTANSINQLLSAAKTGDALIGDRPVQANDIAILVRTGAEAKKVRYELSKQNIASVYMSNKDSVFNTDEAADIQHILAAILNPDSESLIRAALACSLFDRVALDLDQLSENERLWESTQDQFRNYQQHWQKKGVLAMLRNLLNEQQITQRLLSRLGGERQLTDILHLAELLQENSLLLDSPAALLRWLGEQVENADGNLQEQQLRLESDGQLVQVVTIHKSKGLEYNLVFMPFICNFRLQDTALYHEDGKTYLDLESGKEAKEIADGERLAEDLRLLYVALTRGVYATWLGLGPLKKGNPTKKRDTDLHKTAIGYLLQGREKQPSAGFELKLKELSDSSEDIQLLKPLLQELPVYEPLPEEKQVLQARSFNQPIERDWRVTSYSALSYGSQHSYQASDELPGFDIEVAGEQNIEADDGLNIFNFPKGAGPGTFMHTLFEEIDFPHARGEGLRDKLQQLMQLDAYEDKWLPVLENLVADVLDAQLPDGARLRDLSMSDKKVEMEFFIPMAGLNAHQLNQLCKEHDPLSAQANDLHFDQVKGMLKGFIDLVFVYQGRYYVLDYKSNHLGNEPSDYHPEALQAAMVDHRYDLQYQLYTLALHRLLKSRMPDYDYEKHLGGCYYLFLRGMSSEPEHQGYGVFHQKPSAEFINKLDQLFNGELVKAALAKGERL